MLKIENKLKNKFKMILKWLLVLLVMGFIFYLSSQNRDESKNLSEAFSLRFFGFIKNLDLDAILTPIRKCAHFFLYFVLGTCVFWATGEHKIKLIKRLIIACLICFLYAITDEVHQMFVPGRGPMVFDVMVDSLGAVCGSGMCYVLKKLL